MKTYLCISLLVFTLATSVSTQSVTAPAAATNSITADQLTRLDRAEKQLKDWPNLGRYRDANSKVVAPGKNEDRVVFMGDSITDGWKLADYFPGRPFINRGISGQTTPQMLIRFRPDVIALQPKVVVILAGTNDIAGNTGPSTLEMIEDNLANMADLARMNGIRVVLCSVLPVYDYPWKPGLTPAPKIVALNAWMKHYAD